MRVTARGGPFRSLKALGFSRWRPGNARPRSLWALNRTGEYGLLSPEPGARNVPSTQWLFDQSRQLAVRALSAPRSSRDPCGARLQAGSRAPEPEPHPFQHWRLWRAPDLLTGGAGPTGPARRSEARARAWALPRASTPVQPGSATQGLPDPVPGRPPHSRGAGCARWGGGAASPATDRRLAAVPLRVARPQGAARCPPLPEPCAPL